MPVRSKRAAPRFGLLDENKAAIIKGMLVRGDKQSDIAAHFHVNGGRIAEIIVVVALRLFAWPSRANCLDRRRERVRRRAVVRAPRRMRADLLFTRDRVVEIAAAP